MTRHPIFATHPVMLHAWQRFQARRERFTFGRAEWFVWGFGVAMLLVWACS